MDKPKLGKQRRREQAHDGPMNRAGENFAVRFFGNGPVEISGVSLGIAGWLTVGHNFGIAFGILSAFTMNIAYEFGFGTTIYRVYQKPQLDRGLLVAGVVRGALVGFAGAVSGALTGRPEALLYGVQIGVVVGTLNTTITILSPMVEWWADNLPDRALGGYGAVLVLIGSALQTVQYVVPLISRYLW